MGGSRQVIRAAPDSPVIAVLTGCSLHPRTTPGPGWGELQRGAGFKPVPVAISASVSPSGGGLKVSRGLPRAALLDSVVFCSQVGVRALGPEERAVGCREGRAVCRWSPGGGHSEGTQWSPDLEKQPCCIEKARWPPGLSPLSTQKKGQLSPDTADLTATPHKVTSAPLAP